jgi:hypothetical protein
MLQIVVDIHQEGHWDEPCLGGTTRNHLKEWLRNQKRPNCFPKPFTLNVFTTIIFFLMFINYIWLEVYFGIIFKIYIFLIKMVL